MSTLSVKFYGGGSEGVVAMVTYTAEGGNAKLTEFSVTGKNLDVKYPHQAPGMTLDALVDDSGNLMGASAFYDGSSIFACSVGGGPLGNNFQWMDNEGNNVSSDNCKIEGSGV